MDVEVQLRDAVEIITAAANNQLHPLLIPFGELIELYEGRKPHDKFVLTSNILLKSLTLKSEVLGTKLVVKITIPDFTLPELTLNQIHLLPITTNTSYPVIRKTNYEFTATDVATRKYAVFRKGDLDEFKKIHVSPNSTIYVGRLNVPLLGGKAQNECPLSLLYNPHNERKSCEYTILKENPRLLTKLHRKNTWLFSSPSDIKIQVRCGIAVHDQILSGQGILEINEPCDVQLEDELIMYEGRGSESLQYMQPSSHVFNTTEVHESLLKLAQALPGSYNTSHLTLCRAGEANKVLLGGAIELHKLENALDQYEEYKRSKPLNLVHHSLPFVSTALSVLTIIIVITGYCCFKKSRKVKSVQIPMTISRPTINRPRPISRRASFLNSDYISPVRRAPDTPPPPPPTHRIAQIKRIQERDEHINSSPMEENSSNTHTHTHHTIPRDTKS